MYIYTYMYIYIYTHNKYTDYIYIYYMYIYMDAGMQQRGLGAQALMSPQAFFGLVFEGLCTNFWGLGCPSYCTQPSLGLLAFLLLGGWLLGFLSCVALSWFLLGLSPCPTVDFARASVVRLSPSARLLASYLSMSRASLSQDGEVELRISLPGDIQVTVRAPTASAARAAELLGHSTHSAASDRSFELVSSVSDPEVSSPPRPRVSETRDSILRSFEPCPVCLFSHCARLCGSTLSGKERVERAWLAGQWAGAVRAETVGSPNGPNHTPTIDLRPRFSQCFRLLDFSEPPSSAPVLPTGLASDHFNGARLFETSWKVVELKDYGNLPPEINGINFP